MVVGVAYLFVRHAVVVEVGGCGESFAASRTLVWFLAGVDAPVRVERRRRRERLEAHVAYVRFLACNPHTHTYTQTTLLV